MNTIRDAIDENTIVAEVVQYFRSPIYSEKLMIIVEGDDDIKLYKSFFNESKVYFHTLQTNGCGWFESVLKECDDQYESYFIIIKDADFDHLNSKTYYYPNMFLTDTHDMETMIIKDDSINKICQEYNCCFSVNDIMKNIKNYSFLKWYNCKNQCGIKFEVLNIFQLYDGKKDLTIQNCLNSIYANPKNQNKTKISNVAISKFIKDHKNTDLSQLTNGHDLCKSIRKKIYVLNSSKSYNIKDDEIPRLLRVQYTMTDFKHTKLYQSILKWMNQHGKDIFTQGIL